MSYCSQEFGTKRAPLWTLRKCVSKFTNGTAWFAILTPLQAGTHLLEHAHIRDET